MVVKVDHPVMIEEAGARHLVVAINHHLGYPKKLTWVIHHFGLCFSGVVGVVEKVAGYDGKKKRRACQDLTQDVYPVSGGC